MSPEEKSARYFDLNTNERLLEIQTEIVEIEKKRLFENLSPNISEDLSERLKFLVSEQRMIFESRYKNQSKQKFIETENGELKEILKIEIDEEKKIESELKEIKIAAENRMWYEKWWGKLLIIVVGAFIVSLMSEKTIDFSDLVN